MNPITLAMIVFASVFGAALLGMRLRAALPEHHLTSDTKDAVRIGVGLVATMAALLLGMLIASAKGSYDTQKSALMEMAAKIAYLDQALANYGPETRDIRQLLNHAVEAAIGRIWSESGPLRASAEGGSTWSAVLPKAIQALLPKDDAQRTFKTQAAAVTAELGQMRWLLIEQADTLIPSPLLVVLTAWLAIIFGSIGLFAPTNATAVVALMLAALSVSGAILMILELDQPFGGLISISSQPMHNVLNQLVGNATKTPSTPENLAITIP
jgi:hypothetical protein